MSQTELIKSKITRHQNSSPTPINDAVDQFLKGTHKIAHQLMLLKVETQLFEKQMRPQHDVKNARKSISRSEEL